MFDTNVSQVFFQYIANLENFCQGLQLAPVIVLMLY